MTKETVVVRHSYLARVAHWLTVFCFFMVTISGLAFLFPSLRWMLGIMGTPQLAQFLHPVFGIVMVVGMVVLFFRNYAHCLPEKGDMAWFGHLVDILKGNEHRVVEVGHYNPGQKMLFWALMSLTIILLVTGLMVWRPYFAGMFPIPVLRWALFVHSMSAVLMMFAIIVHLYMGFWYKETVRGIVWGTVTRAWAKQHHPRWLRELDKGGQH